MDTRAAFKLGIEMADMVVSSYIGDLSDDELMQRPHPECNHINWQLGHLVTSEHQMNSKALPGSMPPLPPGFAEKYSRETIKSDRQEDFVRKDELMRVIKEQRAATVTALANLADDEFDKPSGISYAPTIGALFSLHGSHWLMHCGQWVIVRRRLGKPQVI